PRKDRIIHKKGKRSGNSSFVKLRAILDTETAAQLVSVTRGGRGRNPKHFGRNWRKSSNGRTEIVECLICVVSVFRYIHGRSVELLSDQKELVGVGRTPLSLRGDCCFREFLADQMLSLWATRSNGRVPTERWGVLVLGPEKGSFRLTGQCFPQAEVNRPRHKRSKLQSLGHCPQVLLRALFQRYFSERVSQHGEDDIPKRTSAAVVQHKCVPTLETTKHTSVSGEYSYVRLSSYVG
ncbi:hypothetical protein BaRGS_00025931, partial [Batillaria attramentaria]